MGQFAIFFFDRVDVTTPRADSGAEAREGWIVEDGGVEGGRG